MNDPESEARLFHKTKYSSRRVYKGAFPRELQTVNDCILADKSDMYMPARPFMKFDGILKFKQEVRASVLEARDQVIKHVIANDMRSLIDVVSKFGSKVLGHNEKLFGTRIWYESSPLAIAIKHGKLDVMRYLIQFEERLDAALDFVCETHKYGVECIHILFEAGMKVDSEYEGPFVRPLIRAAKFRNWRLYDYLIDEKKANIDLLAKDFDFRTLLYYIVKCDNIQRFKSYMIIQKATYNYEQAGGWDIEKVGLMCDDKDNTLLHIAAMYGSFAIFEHFANGMSPSWRLEHDNINEEGLFATEVAIIHNQCSIVRMALELDMIRRPLFLGEAVSMGSVAAVMVCHLVDTHTWTRFQPADIWRLCVDSGNPMMITFMVHYLNLQPVVRQIAENQHGEVDIFLAVAVVQLLLQHSYTFDDQVDKQNPFPWLADQFDDMVSNWVFAVRNSTRELPTEVANMIIQYADPKKTRGIWHHGHKLIERIEEHKQRLAQLFQHRFKVDDPVWEFHGRYPNPKIARIHLPFSTYEEDDTIMLT